MLPNAAFHLLCEKAIRTIASGNPNGIGVIYDHAYPLIYSVAYGILQNHADAEDVCQETLCEILRCASSYKGGSAKAWIISIARNKALNIVKKQSRLCSVEDVEPLRPSADTTEGPEERVICLDALGTLSEKEREAVILKVYCRCRHKEIAHLLDITPSASEKLYQRGLAKLRAYYEEGGR